MTLRMIDRTRDTYELPEGLFVVGTPTDLRVRLYAAPETLGHGEFEEVAVRLLLESVKAGRWVGQSVRAFGTQILYDCEHPGAFFSLVPFPCTPQGLLGEAGRMLQLDLLHVEPLEDGSQVMFPTSRLVRLIRHPGSYKSEPDLA